MRDLLDTRDMLELQERFFAVKQVYAGVELNALVGVQMRVGGC